MGKTIREIGYRLVIIFFATVFIYSGYKVVDYFLQSNANKAEYQEIIELAIDDVKEDELKIQKINIDKLSRINPRVVAWIEIPKTKIFYPVVQGEDNEYYLNHNFKNEASVYGVPFVDYRIDLDRTFNENIIIYGHHMKDGSMFAGLNKYVDREQYQKNQIIYFKDKECLRKYQIISVYKKKDSSDEKDFLSYGFSDKKAFDEYVTEIRERSMYSVEMPKQYKRNLISLCTCEYTVDDGRLVVAGIEVE